MIEVTVLAQPDISTNIEILNNIKILIFKSISPDLAFGSELLQLPLHPLIIKAPAGGKADRIVGQRLQAESDGKFLAVIVITVLHIPTMQLFGDHYITHFQLLDGRVIYLIELQEG